MFSKFLAFVKENKLIEKNDSALIGVSGGADSVVLSNLLFSLKDKLNLKLAIAHVNYGLRKESDSDQRFVENLAKKYEIPIFVKKVKIRGSNLEEQAREIRYSFFSEISEKRGFNKVAVAHHQNDQVETFLFNIARGTGLTGLTGIKPKNNQTIRPMLFASKVEILKYAKEKGLKYVEDTTNKDLSFKRNLIRHKVIPALEEINSSLIRTVSSEIETLKEAEDMLEEEAEQYYKKMVVEERDSVSFVAQDFIKLSAYLKAMILRKVFSHLTENTKDFYKKNTREILQLIDKKASGTKKISLPGKLIAERIYDKITIRKDSKKLFKEQKIIKLESDKTVNFGSWKLFFGKNKKEKLKESKYLVHLNIQKELKLLVRCRKPGDKIAIGENQSKSIQDLFVDVKIPKNERDSYPLIVNTKNEIVWVPGLRLNPLYKGENQGYFIKAKKERN